MAPIESSTLSVEVTPTLHKGLQCRVLKPPTTAAPPRGVGQCRTAPVGAPPGRSRTGGPDEELYLALQQGIVDGAEAPIPIIGLESFTIVVKPDEKVIPLVLVDGILDDLGIPSDVTVEDVDSGASASSRGEHEENVKTHAMGAIKSARKLRTGGEERAIRHKHETDALDHAKEAIAASHVLQVGRGGQV